MPVKRFRTRQYWHRTRTWLLGSTGVLLVCLLWAGGLVPELGFIVGLAFLGALVTAARDRADTTSYLVDRERIILIRAGREEQIGLTMLKDANPLERSTAREYVLQRVREMQEQGLSAVQLAEVRNTFVRYCTVDLGLRPFTLGTAARWMGGTPRDRDLVLLRIRDGREMLLAPVHHQDMVDVIAKLTVLPPAPEEQQRERA